MVKMKDCGVPWVGKIPAHWEFNRVKYHFCNTKVVPGINHTEYERLSLTLKGVVPRSKDDVDGLQPKDFNTYQLLRKDELVFKLIDLQNISTSRVGLSHAEGLVSPAYIILHANGTVLPGYAEKFFLMMWYCHIFNAMGDDGVRSNLGAKDLLNVQICIPPIREQECIAAFLNKKCTAIDNLVASIQSEIESLEAYRKSIIIEGVTYGLDTKAKLRDSGIFYVGPVNAKWRMSKIGYVCRKLARAFDSSDTALICTNKGTVAERGDAVIGLMSSEDNAMQGIHDGDIAIHGMDTWHGAIALSEIKGKITRVVHVCDSTEDKRFVVYYMQSLAFRGVYKLISNGVRGNTSDFRSWDKVKNIWIPLPSKGEQSAICDRIDRMLARVRKIISVKKQQLDVLEGYKRSMIYEYVTGKREVPNEV